VLRLVAYVWIPIVGNMAIQVGIDGSGTDVKKRRDNVVH